MTKAEEVMEAFEDAADFTQTPCTRRAPANDCDGLYLCTRIVDHGGAHVAHGYRDQILKRWHDES